MTYTKRSLRFDNTPSQHVKGETDLHSITLAEKLRSSLFYGDSIITAPY